MTTTKTVMVVDDDEALRESVCELLEDNGYRALCVDGGAAALALLRAEGEKPDLILLDLMMPGMTGWQFREAQLRDPALASIPVVVITASRDLRGIQANEVAYKPLKLAKLLDIVRRHASSPASSGPVKPPEMVVSAAPNGEGTKAQAAMPQSLGAMSALAGGGEMGKRMRAFDWSTSPVGDFASWPQSLRSAMSICLGSRFPICIYWGPELATLYNDGWSTIPGTKHPWALGKPAKEVWPEIWDTISVWFERVVSTGESIYQQNQLLAMHRHGYTEECYFDFTFSPIRGETGQVEGVFNAVVETTFRYVNERRTRVLRELGEATAAARTSRDACAFAARSLGKSAHDVPFCALYLTDDDGVLARLVASAGLPEESPAAPQTIALEGPSLWPLGEVSTSKWVVEVTELGKRLEVKLPGGAWPEAANAALVAPLLTGGKACGFLVLGVNPRRAVDDDYRLFAERAASHVASAIATANDYEKERKRAAELEAIDRAKTAFFSNVSHEFRTPLTLMLGPTHDLLAGVHGPLDDEQRRELEMLHRNGLRLQKLVNALLDFSRLEAGRMQALYEPVDLAATTRELASAFDSAITAAGLTFKSDLEPLDTDVYIDRDMWEKIVLNLLSNALKFTFEGGITLSLRVENGAAVLRVKDTGVGVPADEVPRLFERFHRVEGARSRTHEGSGIGLALVQELAQLHGGSVGVESAHGVGSTFTVMIPLGAAHLPKDRIGASRRGRSPTAGAAPFVEEATRWTSGPALPRPSEGASRATEPAKQPRNARILLADDNADMRDYVRRHLERHWSVDVVEDGQRALASALASPPDLVLTDVMMPGLDGFELLRRLRSDQRTRTVPVIMLSARSGEEARIEGLHAGAEDYLTKPFSASELLARVSTHLELSRLRRAVETERDRLRSLLGKVPAIVNFLRGPDLVYEFAHPLAVAAAGGRILVGKPLVEALPELRDQPFPALLRKVLESGEPIEGREKVARLDRDGSGALRESYWNFTYLPVRDHEGRIEGVMTFEIEVTDQVIARRLLEEGKEQFRRLVTQVQAGIAQTDLTGRFILTNERYQELVGRSAVELRQMRMQDITHPDDLTGNAAQLKNLVEHGTPFVIEKRHVKPDGSMVWVQDSVSRIDDAEGRPHGVAAVSVDITQRRFADQMLRESEERFRNVADNAPVMIWISDPHARGIYFNQVWYEFTGQTPETAAGHGWLDAVHPDDQKTFGEVWRFHDAKRERFRLEYRLRRKDGEYRWAIASASPRISPNGELLGYIGSVIDITDRKSAEEARMAEMERTVRFSEMFIGILGHDLRNPLNSITMAASLLEIRADSEQIARPVSRIVVSADRMGRMISQLLDLTSIRLGRGLPLERASVDLAAVSRAILDELEPVYKREIRVAAVGDVHGMWDADRLSQLLSNLVGNACQHGTSGTPVLIALDGTKPDVVRLEVRNRGTIPAELLPVLFEPLRSGERREKREGSSGLGLGLYITQQIALAHGGQILVKSNEEDGTRFIVDLPRHAAVTGKRAFSSGGFSADP